MDLNRPSYEMVTLNHHMFGVKGGGGVTLTTARIECH